MSYAIKPIPPDRNYPVTREFAREEEGLAPRADSSHYRDLLWANLGLIAGIAAAVFLLGLAWAFVAPPVYRASVLFQVEDANGMPRAVSPNEGMRNFDLRTVGAPELEVLRSRMVLGTAVDNTRAYLKVEPNYFPLLGAFLARQNISFNPPGLLGQGYAWGKVEARVAAFEVPAELENKPFTLTAGERGRWTLESEENDLRLTGRVGETVKANSAFGPLQVRIDALQASPGTEFRILREPRLLTIEKLQRDIDIREKGRQSGIIEVSLEDREPKRATAILKEVVAQYLLQNEERRSEGAEKQLAFLNRQIPELRQALEVSEERLNEARNRRGSVDLGEEARGLLQMSVMAQSRLLELNQKRLELAARFEAAHPQMQAVDEQLRNMTRELNSLNARIKRLPQIEQEILRLARDVKVNTEVYTNVMNTAQQLRLASSSKVGNVRLLDAPDTPVKPVKPRKAIVILSAAIIGLLLGVLVVLMKKSLSGRVYSPADIEAALGLPVGGIILHSDQSRSRLPWRRDAARDTLLPQVPPKGPAVEGLRRLQSSVFARGFRSASDLSALAAPREEDAVIVIVGPMPGVGKSYVSRNFALVLASSGKRVLLIDGDLRTGGLHRNFGLERGTGLAEALEKGALAADSLHRNVAPNLDFLATGRLPPNPSQLLSSASLPKLLREFASRYDVVLVDTAPVLAVADALMIAPHADVLFNVVRSGVTTIHEIEETDRQLRRSGARPAEVIYNDMRSRQSHYGYSAAYG